MSEQINMSAQLEQLEATVRDVGKIFATYYLSLIEEGTPHNLAHELVADYAHLFWIKNLGFPLDET